MEVALDEPISKRRKLGNGDFADTSEKGEQSTFPRLRIGSRKSQLALFQTNFVADLLKSQYTGIKYDIISMATTGDKILDVALSKIGEKSLFTKELEIALEKKDVHLVVHSLKDLPTTLPPGMVIGAISKREDPSDVVVFSKNDLNNPDHDCKDLKDLPDGSVVGTSSLRRIAQLKRAFPNLKFEDIRGNLNTRLKKLDENNTYSALILAAAGLIRLDLEDRINQRLNPDVCMYAVGQGALAIECREDDPETIELISKLCDAETTLRCIAERAFMRHLEGGCSVPIAVHSTFENNKLTLKGGVFNLDGSKSILDELTVEMQDEDSASGSKESFAAIIAPSIPVHFLRAAENLGIDLAKLFLKKGAEEILKETRSKKILAPPSR